MIHFVTNSFEDAVTIARIQSQGGQHRYIFGKAGELFQIRDDAAAEPGYVILAGAFDGRFAEVKL